VQTWQTTLSELLIFTPGCVQERDGAQDMVIELAWLPSFGLWTEAVHGTVVAGMGMAGLMSLMGLAVRVYRVLLQIAAWSVGK